MLYHRPDPGWGGLIGTSKGRVLEAIGQIWEKLQIINHFVDEGEG